MQTRTKYLKQLDDLGRSLHELADKTTSDIRSSARALSGNVDAAEEIERGAKATRRLRSTIEDACLDIMLMQQPLVADDLRFVSGAFRIVSDLSHIDEMTRDIAYLSRQLPEKASKHLTVQFQESSEKVSTMVAAAVDSFEKSDVDQAKRVFALDDEVDSLYDQSEAIVVELIRKGQSAKHLPELLMVAKYFERMGDDAQRIADWAVFRVTGEHAVNSKDGNAAQE